MEFNLVVGEDWEGLYVDGVLYVQGHSIDARDIAGAANLKFETTHATEAGSDYLADNGYLPETLEEWKIVNGD